MYDDQQRRLEALRRLAEQQAGAQRTVEPPQDQPESPKIGAAARNAAITASSHMQHGSRRGLTLGLLGGLTLLTLILASLFSLNRPLPHPTPTPTPDPSHA